MTIQAQVYDLEELAIKALLENDTHSVLDYIAQLVPLYNAMPVKVIHRAPNEVFCKVCGMPIWLEDAHTTDYGILCDIDYVDYIDEGILD